MNKLVIIGNGFDLSLGLKTKYEHFLYAVFHKVLIEAVDSKKKRIDGSRIGFGSSYGAVPIHGYAENQFLTIVILNTYVFKPDELVSRFENIHSFIEEYFKSDQLKIEIKNSILKESIDNARKKWVDIEGTYFELLKNQLNYWFTAAEKTRIQTESKKELWGKIKLKSEELNIELNQIKVALIEYLNGLEIKSELKESAEEHFTRFQKPIVDTDGTTHQASIVHLLNFNYTNSIESFCETYNFQIGHIHGKLDENIIFGYGDEMDVAYKEMEELNENCFFEHIKSFGYFRNDRYRQLLGFMDSGKFQVVIYGHSCGLSDRVLLNEIFEHENCHSIRVYHRGEEDYINKTMEISRHFNSNQLLRNRILPFNAQDAIPQV